MIHEKIALKKIWHPSCFMAIHVRISEEWMKNHHRSKASSSSLLKSIINNTRQILKYYRDAYYSNNIIVTREVGCWTILELFLQWQKFKNFLSLSSAWNKNIKTLDFVHNDDSFDCYSLDSWSIWKVQSRKTIKQIATTGNNTATHHLSKDSIRE